MPFDAKGCIYCKTCFSLVQDDLKLLDDSGKIPKLNIVVGRLIPGHEIVSPLDKKLAR
jgi:hypothetical protein